MAIPQNVKQRAQNADELILQSAQAQPTDSTDANPDVAEPDNTNTTADDVVATTTSTDDLNVDDVNVVAKQLSDLRGQVDHVEQKYRTLQGMMRSSEEENKRLKTILSEIEENTKSNKSSEPDVNNVSNIDDKRDRDDFGSDFVDMVNRVVARQLAPIKSQVKEVIDRLAVTEGLARSTQETTAQTQQERFEAQLTSKVPEWRKIDSTDHFREWLSNSNARLAIVREAMANYDAYAVAEVFELYSQLHGKGKGDDAPEPASKKLESKVAPSKGRTSSSVDAEPDKKIWKRSEIAQVFNNRNNYDRKEFERLQKDIFDAQREGRVIYEE